MAKSDNNQNTEKLTTRDKAQVNMLANSISAQLISFFGKNFGSLNSNFSNLNQEISNVSENISSVNNSSYSHIIRDLNKSLNISKSFIKKHLDTTAASNLVELQERKKFLEESGEDNTKELKATNKEIIKIMRKLAGTLQGQQVKALANDKKAKEEAQLEQDRLYKEQRLSKRPENIQNQLLGLEKNRWDFSKLTAKERFSMVSDLKSGTAPEKILAQIKSLQTSNLDKRMAALNAENAYYKRENSFYEDLAEVQKDLLKFQDKREQYFDYAEKVVGKLHEQEISVQDRKRLAYDTERKNYIEALKLSKLQQQIEDTRAKTWFLEGGLTKNMIAYRADSEKYIQTVKDNFKNKLLQPFRTMKKWWSNTKSIFSFGKDLIGSFFGRKPTGTQKQPEQVKNNKAEVIKDDTEEIKDRQETEEYHDDIRSKFDKLLDFFLGSKTASAIKEKKSTPTQAGGEGSGGSDWLSWLAIASNFMPGKLLKKGIWGLGKFGVKGIGAALKSIGKFALNPVATTKAIGKSVAAVPGAIKTFATKKATDIGKSIVSKATAVKQFAVNKVNTVKSTASKVAGKAIAFKDTAIKKATAFKNVVANSETGQAVAKGFNFVKEKAGKAAGGIKESYKAKGLWGVRSFLQGAITKFVPKGLLAQFKSLYAKFAKPVAKLLVKFGGTTGLKAAAKGLPGLGAILGIVFAIHRAAKGDWWGALLELASGLAGGLLPPGVGLAVSAGIEAALAYKDFKTVKEEESLALAPAKTINTNAGRENLAEEDKELIKLENERDAWSKGEERVKGKSNAAKELREMANQNWEQTQAKISEKVQSGSQEMREKHYAREAARYLKAGDTLEDLPTVLQEAYLKHQGTPAKSVTTKSKPLPKIERAPVNNNNTQQNNNNGRDDAKLASILERIDSKMGNVAENTANPRVTSVPVPMETSVADYSGGANAQMQGI